MPAAASRLRHVAPFGQKKHRSCYTFSDQTRKEERTTWESIAQNRPHVRRCAVSVHDEAVEYCAHHVPRTACGARTGTGTKWRGEAFLASDVAARMCTPPGGGLCGLRNPKWYPPNEVSREAGAMRGAPLLRCRKAADGRERCQKRLPAPRSARLDFNCDF